MVYDYVCIIMFMLEDDRIYSCVPVVIIIIIIIIIIICYWVVIRWQ